MGAAACTAVLLSGCGASPVEVAPPRSAPPECASLVQALPSSVAGQERRDVEPAGSATAAWGDPAIVLRCGVPAPPRLRPSSPCAEVEQVGWFAEQQDAGYRFTTIGRSTYVQVTVPYDYEPAADALVDLADAVRSEVAQELPCV